MGEQEREVFSSVFSLGVCVLVKTVTNWRGLKDLGEILRPKSPDMEIHMVLDSVGCQAA